MRKQWGCSWNGYNAGIEETVDLHKYQRNFEGLKDDLCGTSDKWIKISIVQILLILLISDYIINIY